MKVGITPNMGFTKEPEMFTMAATNGAMVLSVSAALYNHRYLGDWTLTLLLAASFGVLSLASLTALGGLWSECGGPGLRAVAYHAQLQRRMQASPVWEWASWFAGVLLRAGLYLGVLVLAGMKMVWVMPERWGVVGALFCFSLAATLAGIGGVILPRLLFGLVGGLWARLEPPELTEDSSQEGIGVAPREAPPWARPLRYLPLAVISALLNVAAYASTSDRLLGFQRACWGLALLAILGYPLHLWSRYLSSRI